MSGEYVGCVFISISDCDFAFFFVAAGSKGRAEYSNLHNSSSLTASSGIIVITLVNCWYNRGRAMVNVILKIFTLDTHREAARNGNNSSIYTVSQGTLNRFFWNC